MTRPLYVIAAEIRADWHPIWFGAVPYVEAMECLHTLDESYGADSADRVVGYFLSNARYWKGETARRIKEELRAMIRYSRPKR